ncbi:L,D-transpeptidase [Microvirga thermotolerans]|uniref:L,D-transpeptidase family protein n=1 Tax=Microvirga thermotolerans TaxID=2651334 RepID=A0A5P9JZP5_9HYPH|nr:L,D-transpeptidase [Microvirga thermotolerans]QFU16745.1 L,D-transpeptidase family protein [Microvirga thermotolerans]
MDLSRRSFLLGAPALTSLALLPRKGFAQAQADRSVYAAMYAPIDDDLYPVPGVPLSKINPAFLRREVPYDRPEPPGTIVIDPRARYLYHVQDGGTAMRYGVGVGRAGFSWSGEATVHDKQEWPDWYPPKEMFGRQPELMEQMGDLPGGPGMPGGPGNPLGARALYLWQGNKDTLYRIHGTFEPWTIGTNVSSGCIRMINQDVIDLYNRVPVGTRVVVLPSGQGTRRSVART